MKDITSQVSFGNPDDEALPLTKCVCGKSGREWGFITLSIYKEYPTICSNYGRKMIFSNNVRVFELEKDE